MQKIVPLRNHLKEMINMKDIAIYGFGGFGREVTCVINAINAVKPEWNFLGYFDDGHKIGEYNNYGAVLGGIDELNAFDKPLSIVIAIANPSTIEKIFASITNNFISFPNIIAPNVLFFDRNSFKIGKGNIITFGCRMSCGASLGNFNICNGCVSLGHDVSIGNFNVLQPEVRISGETVVEDSNFFGVRAVVLQGLQIGSNTRIGTCSVIMRNTKDGYLYVGNPAKKVEI